MNDLLSRLSGASGDDPDELFDLVDLDDRVIGEVRRGEAHHDPTLTHRSVQILIFDAAGRVLLQRRSQRKDLFPGYYCASASGHVMQGEEYAEAAMREIEEELGITLLLAYVGKQVVRSEYETEITALFLGRSAGPFAFHPKETDGGEFYPLAELQQARHADNEQHTAMTPALLAALDSIAQLQSDGVLAALLAEL